MQQIDFETLQEAYNLRGIELHHLHERVATLEDEVAHLKELLKLQQSRLFGKSSETSNSLHLPTKTNTDALPPLASDSEQKLTVVSEHLRKAPTRGMRQLNTKSLPKYTVIHDLPMAEQICTCCGRALHVIGQDKSEQLEIIPVQYCIIEHIRLKYGCRPCDSVVMAPKPPAPLPKAIAGPSLLTNVILSKYQYHLPLYRQSKIMQSRSIK